MKKTVKILFMSLMLAFMVVMLPDAVQAAEEATLSVDSKTVWVGSGGYTFTVKNINKEDYTIYYTVENKEMAEVNYKTGYVKGINTGDDATTKFYAVLVHNKTGEVTILNVPLYVKEKASRVEITNKELSEVALLAGDKIDFNAVMYNRAGQSTSTRGKYVTDYMIWTSSNTDVAEVNRTTGVVTAKKSGKATIYVRTYVYSNGTGNYSAEDSVDVYVIDCIPTCKPTATPTVKPTVKPTATPTVKPGATATPTPPVYEGSTLLLSAKQSTRNSIKLEFNKDVSKDLTKDILSIRSETTSKKMYIKSISFSEDGRTVEVTLWNTIENECMYSVLYDNCEMYFISTDGKVSYIEVESKFVEVMEPTTVSIKFCDKSGVDLTTTALLDSLIYDCYNGFFDMGDNTITLYEEGDEAILTVTYAAPDYDSSTGSYPIITGVGYFEAMERVPVELTEVKVNIGRTVNYSKESYTIAQGDSDIYIYARALFSDNSVKKTEMDEGDLIFETSDPTKLLVGDDGELVAIAMGVVEVVIRDAEYTDEILAVYPIQIIEEREVAKTSISQSNITLTKNLSADTAEIKISIYDQYGKALEPWDDIDVVPIESSSSLAQEIDSSAIDLNVLTLNGGMFSTAGTYRYRIYYGDFSHYLTVKVVTPKEAISSHKISLSNTKINTTYSEDNDDIEKTLTIKLFSYDSNNHKIDIIKRSSVNNKGYGYGYTITKRGISESSDLTELPEDGIILYDIITEDSNGLIEKRPEGTYTIRFYLTDGEVKKSLVTSANFTITDSQDKPSITLNQSEIDENDIDDDDYIIECFNINGEPLDSAANSRFDVYGIETQVVSSTLWVKKLILFEYFGDSYIQHDFDLKAMLTIK